MNSEEQVQTLTTQVEPLTGDKRRREDAMDEGPLPPSAPRSNNFAMGNNNVALMQQQQQQQQQNFMQSMMAGGLDLMQQNNNGLMPGHDALYIGDLQWVRLFCRLLSSPVHLSEVCFSRRFCPLLSFF